MCKFFSCISDGKGQTLYFTIEDIVKEMVKDNPNQYEWNSHTSIASFCGIKGANEDKWNKWEYDVNTKELKVDQLNTKDDSEKVKRKIEKYLEGKNLIFLQNFYNKNSGNWNSGNRNSGNWNSGDCNSGNWNSGNRNSGNCNSGDCNSGDYNSGNCNSGHSNSGNCNSGDCNSGDYNSGNCNSGNRNSGNYNSGDYNSGFFNTKRTITMFNKDTKKEDIKFPSYMFFNLSEYISTDKMTIEEQHNHPEHVMTGGYLKVYDYKEAWRKAWDGASQEEKKATLKLPNFNAKIFFEITGIDVKKEKI